MNHNPNDLYVFPTENYTKNLLNSLDDARPQQQIGQSVCVHGVILFGNQCVKCGMEQAKNKGQDQ